MISLELPTEQTPHYTYKTKLSDTEYILSFYYSVRQPTCWYLSVYDVNEVLLLSNVRITPWMNLLYPYTKELLPKGSLTLVPKSGVYPQSPDITLENLSTEFLLIYIG